MPTKKEIKQQQKEAVRAPKFVEKQCPKRSEGWDCCYCNKQTCCYCDQPGLKVIEFNGAPFIYYENIPNSQTISDLLGDSIKKFSYDIETPPTKPPTESLDDGSDEFNDD